MAVDYTDEIINVFRQYCKNPDLSFRLSDQAMGYLRHCLEKALSNARSMGESPDIYHHQMFSLMALETDNPEKVTDFLIAAAKNADYPPPTR